MPQCAIEHVALFDPDARPLTGAGLEKMKCTPQAKLICRALGVTHEELAARYPIPLGTLRTMGNRTTPELAGMSLSDGDSTRS
jgi:hypothetical protein